MKKSGYALKRQRGLVPHEYRRDERFHLGAHKWWPARGRHESVLHYEQRKADLARAETPSNNGYLPGHTFVGGF